MSTKTYDAIKARVAARKATKRKDKRPKPIEASKTVAKVKDESEA